MTSIFESNFNKKLSSTYDLSALVSEDRFYFMVHNAQREMVLLRNYQKHHSDSAIGLVDLLESVFDKDDVLHLPFQSSKIAVFNQKQTLIPSKLFLENEKATYLEKVTDLLPGDVLQSNKIDALELEIVYALDMEEKASIVKYFGNLKLYHGISSFLSGVFKLAEQRKGNQIYLNLRDKLLHIVLFEDNALLFSNIFSFSASQDVLYYVMLVFDQFGLDPKTTPLFLSGQIVKDSEVYNLLYRYIEQVQFIDAPEFLEFGPAAKELAKHQFYDLFSLILCE